MPTTRAEASKQAANMQTPSDGARPRRANVVPPAEPTHYGSCPPEGYSGGTVDDCGTDARPTRYTDEFPLRGLQ